MADDLGYSDLGAYGSEINTPNLDRLAEQGVMFSQFYNTAKCTQTRASVLTGLYHHQTENLTRADNNRTLAEIMGDSGYETIMAGKWHLGEWRKEQGTPTDRGFDHFFGFLGGAINYFTGVDWGTGENYMRVETEEYDVGEDFYATDDFTTYAIEEVEKAHTTGHPFFLYLSYNAPHFPLQVPEEEIGKYEETYRRGWDRIRKERYQRMVEMGLIKENWGLTKRDTLVPLWEELTPQQKEEETLLMATYAGMVDRMDQQIGRLMQKLRDLEIDDNTIVMFLSDNGGCPFDFNRTPDKMPGPPGAARSYNVEWANVSNTPFKNYKQWIHEGGIATPFIIRWSDEIPSGKIVRHPGHIVDIMPTILNMTGIPYRPSEQGSAVLPPEGHSLVGSINGIVYNESPMFWEFRGSRAVRLGKWKLVGERGGPWELYDMDSDRTENHNLVERYPQKAGYMAKKYDNWADRVGATSNREAVKMPLNRRSEFTFDRP